MPPRASSSKAAAAKQGGGGLFAPPDPKETQREQQQVLRDIKEKMFRAAVVPAAYSVEEWVMAACAPLPEFRLKTIRLTEDEVRCVVGGRHGMGITAGGVARLQQPAHTRVAHMLCV